MQYSIHAPSEFVCKYRDQLLPAWSRPVASVLVVLQPCSCELLDRTPDTEAQKHQLRSRFLQFGYKIATRLQQLGHLADVFDPQTGLPLLSQPGQLKLDDVAVVQACLGYEAIHTHGCRVLQHPTWGSSVYPSTVVSSAAPDLVTAVSQQFNQIQLRDSGDSGALPTMQCPTPLLAGLFSFV